MTGGRGRRGAQPLGVVLGLLRADAPGAIMGAPQDWPRWAVLLPHVLAAAGHLAASPPAAGHGRGRRRLAAGPRRLPTCRSTPGSLRPGRWPNAPWPSPRPPTAPTTPTSPPPEQPRPHPAGPGRSRSGRGRWPNAPWPSPRPPTAPTTPTVATRLNNLATILRDLGQPEPGPAAGRTRPGHRRGRLRPRPPHRRHRPEQPRPDPAGPGEPEQARPLPNAPWPSPRPPTAPTTPRRHRLNNLAAILRDLGSRRRPGRWPNAPWPSPRPPTAPTTPPSPPAEQPRRDPAGPGRAGRRPGRCRTRPGHRRGRLRPRPPHRRHRPEQPRPDPGGPGRAGGGAAAARTRPGHHRVSAVNGFRTNWRLGRQCGNQQSVQRLGQHRYLGISSALVHRASRPSVRAWRSSNSGTGCSRNGKSRPSGSARSSPRSRARPAASRSPSASRALATSACAVSPSRTRAYRNARSSVVSGCMWWAGSSGGMQGG